MAYADPAKQAACARKYYLEHKSEYLARNKVKRAKMRDFIQQEKSKPCDDCDQRYPYYVMDFDHREGVDKTGELNRLVMQLSWRRLLAEIAKCDLVCSNCHRIRTHMRLGAKKEPNAKSRISK